MSNEKIFYSVKELSRMFSISKSFIYKQIWNGKLIPIKIGTRTLVKLNDFYQLFEIPLE